MHLPGMHTARNANTSRAAIGYVRVSTEQQADSGLSIAAQRVKLEALATLNDFQLIDVVVDAGASAKSLDRPGWQRVMGAVHGRQVGAVLIAKLDRCTRSRRRPRLVDRHVQPPRGGTHQCSRVTGHQQRGRAPRGQRARRRGAVGAGSNRRAHVSSAAGAQAAGPRHRRGGALRVPVHRRAPGMAPGRAGNARGHHRAPRRRPLMGEGGRQAQRHRAPHPHRRPVDTPGRPPGPPGARTRRPSYGKFPDISSHGDDSTMVVATSLGAKPNSQGGSGTKSLVSGSPSTGVLVNVISVSATV